MKPASAHFVHCGVLTWSTELGAASGALEIEAFRTFEQARAPTTNNTSGGES